MALKQSSNEFEALIDDDGKIAVPPQLRKQFDGTKLHVRLHKEEISGALRSMHVTEDEVERISIVQLESREQVIKFLLCEGVFAKDRTFIRRAKGQLSRRGTKH